MAAPARPPAPARRPMDRAGVAIMLALSVLYASNNLMVKLGTEAFQPVFMAALRSGIGLGALVLWMRARGIPFRRDLWAPGLLIGAAFAAEFFFLFIAMDLTSVVRAVILIYAMPLWTALAGHFLFPGERLTPVRLAGFLAGFAGVALTLAAQGGGASGTGAGGNLAGDLMALAAGASWTAIVIVARRSRLSEAEPETQLFWQLVVSAPLLMALAPLYGGEMLRAVTGWQIANVTAQGLGIAFFGFLLWFWLLRRYPSGAVASFGFLTPVMSVGLGWLVLNEPVSAAVPLALALLVTGLVLINRR